MLQKRGETLPACSLDLKGRQKPFTEALWVEMTDGETSDKMATCCDQAEAPLQRNTKTLTAVISFLFIAVDCRQWTPAGRVSLTSWRPLPHLGLPLSKGRISVDPLLKRPNLPHYMHFFPPPLSLSLAPLFPLPPSLPFFMHQSRTNPQTVKTPNCSFSAAFCLPLRLSTFT